MEVKQKIIRVYGINNANAKSFFSFFKNCFDKPIKIKDYPRKNENIEINIVNHINSIQKLDIQSTAISMVILNMIFKGSIKDFDNEIKTQIKNIGENIKIDYKFFITLIFEKIVYVNNKHIIDSNYCWLQPEKQQNLKNSIVPYASKCFDIFSTYLSINNKGFFTEIVINDQMYISAPNKIETGILGDFSATGELSLIYGKPIEYTDFEKFFKTITSIKFKEHTRIEPTFHFYLSTIGEKDPWKHYYYSFNAFELSI